MIWAEGYYVAVRKSLRIIPSVLKSPRGQSFITFTERAAM